MLSPIGQDSSKHRLNIFLFSESKQNITIFVLYYFDTNNVIVFLNESSMAKSLLIVKSNRNMRLLCLTSLNSFPLSWDKEQGPWPGFQGPVLSSYAHLPDPIWLLLLLFWQATFNTLCFSSCLDSLII